MDKETFKKISDEVERASSYINISLGAVVDIADAYMTDCVEMMKKSGVYRQRVKWLVSCTKKEVKSLENVFLFNVKGRNEMYMEMLDIITEDVRPHIQKLFYSIKNVLDRVGADDSGMKASVMLVYILLYIGCKSFDVIVEDINEKTGVSFVCKMLSAINPTSATRSWKHVMDELRGFENIYDKAYNDRHVKLGISIVIKHLTDEDFMNLNYEKFLKRNEIDTYAD